MNFPQLKMIGFDRNVYGSGLISYGDSFTFSSTTWRYSDMLASLIYGPRTNHAVNGQQSRTTSGMGVVKPLNRTQVMSIMTGLNDMLNRKAAAVPGIVNNIKSVVAVGLLRNNVPASAMRFGGVWFDGNTVSGGRARSIGGTPKGTSGAPGTAYREWDFTGDNVVVGTISTYASSAPYKDVAVYVDGVRLPDLINRVRTSDQYGNNVGLYTGLGEGEHTLRVEPISAGSTTMIDYVGTLKAPEDCMPIIVGHIPRVHSANSYGLTAAMVDAANVQLQAMVDEFAAWPVRAARVNDFYNAQTMSLPDRIHPTHRITSPAGQGMDRILEAFVEHLQFT